MTRPHDRHLEGDELDALVFYDAPDLSASAKLSEGALSELKRHIESCEDCRRMVEMHRSVQNEISGWALSGDVPKGPNCPEESEWIRVVAGVLGKTEATELMNHAAQCGHCGPLLKAAVQTLSDETTPAEEAMLANLTSARPDWQAQMAQTLQGVGKPPRPVELAPSFWNKFFPWPRPAFAVAILAILVTVAWFGLRMVRPGSAEQLLAEAYAERRTMEVRIPGAKFGPLRVERSGPGSNFDKPEPLLKAEALISEKLRKNPNDPAWLEAKGRADLLDGNYDDAIRSLQKAREFKPDSPPLLTDLGSAYFLRAKSADSSDYGPAYQAFSRALELNPRDPVALFNRALAAEQVPMYRQAEDDWEHYLLIDPQGEWAEEARSRLAAIKAKLQRQQQGQLEPLLDPSQIATSGSGDVSLEERVDERVEQYLHVAITVWLPQAFSKDGGKPSHDARVALVALSDIARTRHGDTWLSDLLRGPTGGQFPSGLKELAASVQANDRGDYSAGQRFAHAATFQFESAGNTAAKIRAEAEEVYSDHLLWEGPRCLALLSTMRTLLNRASYTWIQAQMSLEESNCANAVGDLGTYESAIKTGLIQAKTHNYLALYLRAIGFEVLAEGSAGELNTAFSLAIEGLKLYWLRRTDLIKGYNLYFNLESVVEEMRLPYFQVALLREAAALIDGHPDILQRAMAHRWYGNAAYLANMPQLAASEFEKASTLLAASPKTDATLRDYMDAEVWLAHAEIAQGDLDQAAKRLQVILPTLRNAPSFDPEVGFYTAEANIAMQRADRAAAESSVRSAVFLAEWALASYPSDRDRRQWAEQTRDTYREAVEWKLREGDPTAALELWEWYRGATLRANDAPSASASRELGADNPPDPYNAPPLPTPDIVSKRLPLLRDETVIAYGVFPDGIEIWAYDDRGIFPSWAPMPSAQADDLVSRFERLSSDRTSDLVTLRATAHQLYDLLVAPVKDQLDPNRTILFEPDDMMAAIPWDSLVDDSGHYLVEHLAIVVTPSLYRAMRLRHPMPIGQEAKALVVSVPSAGNLTPLSDAEDEAEVVSGKFNSARWLQGGNATIASIRREMQGASVFHFAGHAEASSLRNGLLLEEVDSKTGRSTLITSESFPPEAIRTLQLAVLSACHTGQDVQTGNAGTENLVDALIGAGVPHVIASLWNVDSRETSGFMKDFYTHLLDGNDAAHAMRTARLTLASRPASGHPYYWSAFELRGSQ